jgi:histidine ammonia-lyase
VSEHTAERRLRTESDPLTLSGRDLDARAVEQIALEKRFVALDRTALEAVERNRNALDAAIERGDVIYGVTTGLGALVRTRVSLEEATRAQGDILRSHAAGVGEPLPRSVVRAALAIRLNGLLRARSGVRPVICERIAQLLNEDIIAYVPRTGSLGASGDLTPSAHTFLILIGEGEVLTSDPTARPAAAALEQAGIQPLELAPKEALALINGTHFMTGIGALVALRVARLLDSADAIAALSLDASRGEPGAFERRVQELRPVPGQVRSAEIVRALTSGSERVGTREGGVQDAYSLRCVPQVHGAAREAASFFERLVQLDLNAMTDNPIVFDDPVEVVSAGNFHGQTLALAFDTLRIGLSDLGSISERRTFRLLSPSLNMGLPAFLSPDAGTSSGYMVAQYTAAALLTEARALAHPVSIDSVPTSDNQEDHVSMGMTAALLTLDTLDRIEQILAVEALCGAQALELVPGRPGEGCARILALIRERVPPLTSDRPPAGDIEAVRALVAAGAFSAVVEDLARVASPATSS